jgi:hypothetical protein
MGHVFSTRTRPQNLNTRRKLVLNVCYKGLKNKQDLRFGQKKIDPSIPTEIIYECHKIFISSMRNYRRNAPYITMHNSKAFCRTTTMRRKRKSLTLTKFAYRIVK